jgi:GGDEF domain-containing protein
MMTPETRGELLMTYAKGPEVLKVALARYPKESLDFSPGPGKWSIQDVVFHLAEAELHGYLRGRTIIAESGAGIQAFDQDRWAQSLDVAAQPMDEVVDLVQSEAAHAWQAPEIALVNIMAALFASTMEVEALKIELARSKEMLDLTAAVMEDHALESPGTGLPTRRYLDVWCRTNLPEARRRREVIALATWIQPPAPDRDQRLARLAGSLRGMDLVVELGRSRFLLVLPRTLQAGAGLVLQRLQSTLGIRELGATLWNPLLGPDRDAATLQPAIRRAQLADPGSLERCARGADDGGVVWTLLEPSRANLLGESNQW